MLDKIQKHLWQILFFAAMAALTFTGVKLAGETMAHGRTQSELAGVKTSFANYITEQTRLNAEAKDLARANEQKLQAAADQERKAADETISTLRRERDAARRGLQDRPTRAAGSADAAGLPAAAGPRADARGCTAAQLYREDAELALDAGYDFEELRAEYLKLWNIYQRARAQDPGSLTDGK